MDVMAFASGLIYIPFLLLFGAFIFGSVLARRGEKSWRTMVMLIGSIAQGVAIVFYIVAMVLMISNAYGSSSSSSMLSGMEVWGLIMLVSGLLFLGGMASFAIAFVAYCARAGAAGKRVAELEEMLGHLQHRLTETEQGRI